MESQKTESLFTPLEGKSFRFSCHRGISCFTKCCGALNLMLTPYDILRIKNRLGISSDDFLDKYTDTVFQENARFPMVKLRMNQDSLKKCPFVSPEGCSIYDDRPGSCRLYPLGRASLNPGRGKGRPAQYFLVTEEHCLGFRENRLWKLEDWMAGEGMSEYNLFNDRWIEVVTFQKSLGPAKMIPGKLQMFFMASYNLDRFRKFIQESPFLKRFEVEVEIREKLACDDIALLDFSIEWLKLSLFGEPSDRIRPRLPG
ncbi:MAG: YkgJ family cysteine cluster protein [Deltaproteobacteria bacterium]|nr:YkgJ family cysteine cluster protein [Deltaproteobacteria bacterium]